LRPYVFWFAVIPLAAIFIAAMIWLTRSYLSCDLTEAEFAQSVALWVALPALIALLYQTRANSIWNAVRSYHEFFPEVPEDEKRDQLATLFLQANIEFPSLSIPMTDANIETMAALIPVGSATPIGRKVVAARLRDYLDAFEVFAGAIHRRVVDEEYAYCLEGTRLIVTYFGFRHFIESLRGESESTLKFLVPNGNPVHFLKSKAYAELERVAKEWMSRRLDDDLRLDTTQRKAAVAALFGPIRR
jgi:hypothetical protein